MSGGHAPGYRSISQLRADLAGALAENVGPHRSEVDRGLSDLAVNLCRYRLVEAVRAEAHPRFRPTIEQVLDRLAAAGVEVSVNVAEGP